MSVNLEYVVSAVGMTGILNSVFTKSEHFQTGVVPAIHKTVDTLKTSVKQNCKHTDPTVATLFNAYTEAKFTKELSDYDRLHMDAIYSDSGGLQIVTAGKEVNDKIKSDIYKVQTYSDYAMCFDVIPLERKNEDASRTRNERSNVGNKIFNQTRHKESGRLTGINVKNQIRHFQENQAETKVIIIVQGNQPEDMVLFFDEIQKQLSDDDWNNVGGIAVADTCMGNKDMETVDLVNAAVEISKIAHPNALKQLHFLGVGSLPRMIPVLWSIKSKYLDAYKKISYDSSSHTVCFNYGLMKLNGTCKALGNKRNPKLENTLEQIYYTFEDSFSIVGSFAWYMDNVFFPDKNNTSWEHSKISRFAKESGDFDKIVGAALSNFTYSMYQVKNFIECIDRIQGGEFIGSRSKHQQFCLEMLKKVKNRQQMEDWKNAWSSAIPSSRIERKEDNHTLEGFY